MNYNSIHECNAKIYASGMVVLYKKHNFGERTVDELTWQANKKRTYTISKSKIRSACIRAWQMKKSKNMLFITFTFPFYPTEEEGANIWNRILKNLKENYAVNYYVWVKERQKSGRLHYHIIIDRDRIGIENLQKSYNSAISHVRPDVDVSNNSVRLGRNPIIRSVLSVANYLSKYISKENTETFSKKVYGFTTAMEISKEIDTEKLLEIDREYGCNIVFNEDFFEVYQVNIDFSRNFIDFFDKYT